MVPEYLHRVVVVTGAASGIGYALASAFQREGAFVVLADVEESAVERAAATLDPSARTTLAVRCDVSDQRQVHGLREATLARFGPADVLCNNAGVSTWASVASSSLDEWRWVTGVNLWGVLYGIKTFLPDMTHRGSGIIVNTASIGGLVASPRKSQYAATKHAVIAISECLQHELRADRSEVRVAVLCPGRVATRLVDSARNRPAEYESGTDPELLERLRAQAADGIAPDVVATCALQGIQEGRFYIYSDADSLEDVRRRHEGILTGFLPAEVRTVVPDASR